LLDSLICILNGNNDFFVDIHDDFDPTTTFGEFGNIFWTVFQILLLLMTTLRLVVVSVFTCSCPGWTLATRLFEPSMMTS
jgi:hypothetical protein